MSHTPPYVTALAGKLVTVMGSADSEGLQGLIETVLLENASAVPNRQNEQMDKAVQSLWNLTREAQELRFPISPDCVVRVVASQPIVSKAQLKAIAKGIETFSEFFIEPTGGAQ